MRDYNGHIADWNEWGLVPVRHQEFVDFIEERLDDRDVIELGSGNGIISAALARKHRVLAVDRRYPDVQGKFLFMMMDCHGDDFFKAINSADHPAIVGRRSFCIFYSPEWTQRLTDSKAEILLIQSLEGDKGYMVNTSEKECMYLERFGWKTERTGDFVCATR